MNPDISVVLPTYNRGRLLVKTVKDVLGQSYENFELIIVDQTVDNLSTIKELSEIKDKRVRYFHTTPASLPAARNFALSVAKSPIVLYLDDDVELHKDLLKYHLETHNIKGVAAVAGRVMQEGFPIFEDVLKFNKYSVSKGVFTATKAGYTNAFPGGNHSIKVSIAKDLGGYDTRYYGNAFREESDMSLRLIKRGYKIYYEPKAELLHLAEPSGGTRTKVYKSLYDNPMFYRNEIFFTLRSVSLMNTYAALFSKYKEYCMHYGKKKMPYRSLLFIAGIFAALKRFLFDKEIIQTEI